jgi:hypothetical protein
VLRNLVGNKCRAYRQADTPSYGWERGGAANQINSAIDRGRNDPRAESIVPLSRFPSVFSRSPLSPTSAFRTFVIRIVKFSAIHTCPSILSCSAVFSRHNILLCPERSLGFKICRKITLVCSRVYLIYLRKSTEELKSVSYINPAMDR